MLTLEGLKSKIKPTAYLIGTVVVLLFILQFVVSLFTRGSVRVTTQPAGATVYVDGFSKGTTPQTISGLIPMNHQIKVSADGFVSETRQVSVQPRETTNLNIALISAPIPVTVESGRATDLAFTDSGLLVYSLATSQTGRELRSFDPKTSAHRSLGDTSQISTGEIAWARDGKAGIVDRDHNIWILAGGTLSKTSAKGYSLTWNPDSASLAYGSDRYISFTDPEGINVYNLSSGKSANILSDTSTTPRQISWSPNGQKLLTARFTDEGVSDPTLVDLAGKTQALSTGNINPEAVYWGVDSQSIFVESGGAIYKIDLTKSETTLVFAGTGKSPAVATTDNGVIVGDRISGELDLVEKSEIRTILEEGDPIHEIAAKGNNIAIATSTKLILFSLSF